MSSDQDVFLLERKPLSRRDSDLQLDQVQPRDQFRHRMLHLQPRVHLQEIKVLLLVHKKLDGPGIPVPGGFGHEHCDFSHAAAHVGIDQRRRSLLQHLLMPPLYGTLAFA